MAPKVSLHFENCESLDIAPEDITFLHMGGITDSFTYGPRYQAANKVASFVSLSVRNRPEYRRILLWNDVLCVNVDDVTYYVDWHKADEESNRYQKSEIDPRIGDISVVITKEDE